MGKRATIKDVAKLAGTSVTTVSLILNRKSDRFSQATVDKVHMAQRQLNYLPDYFAQNMTAKTTQTIGVLVPDINNPFFSQFVQGVEEIAYQADFIPLIYNVGPENKRVNTYLKALARRTVDGFIIATSDIEPTLLHRYLQQNHVPYIALDQSVATEDSDQIQAGDFAGGKAATEYLLQHRHQQIGIVLPRERSNNISKRLAGYQAALKEAGIRLSKNWQIEKPLSKEGGYQSAMAVIQSGVSAVFAVNDEMAIGLYRGLRVLGKRVPEDISIIGYDDIEWCDYVQPRLTTMRQSIVEIGQVATELLLSRIQQPNRKTQVVQLATSLVERESVINYQEGLK